MHLYISFIYALHHLHTSFIITYPSKGLSENTTFSIDFNIEKYALFAFNNKLKYVQWVMENIKI